MKRTVKGWMGRVFGPTAAILAAGLALAGCSTTGSAPVGDSAPGAGDGQWRGREGVQDALSLLNRGEADEARQRLNSVLRRDPSDGVARQLLSQIDGDPRQLLGTESYAYTVREGETFSVIAQRVLGNPMMFYILARYNNIAVPQSLRPGQVIRVPGRRPARRAEPRPQRPAAPPPRSETARPSAPAPTPAPQRPATNPAQAARLRAQGLTALNAGQVDRAVALLRQALAADPGNAMVRGDLERALRIQRTVRSRG